MSLGIAFKGPEGIVLAADSRVTLTAQVPGQAMIIPAFYDNATKLLKVNGQDFIGVVTYGLGAIGGHDPRTAHSFLPEFEKELNAQEVRRLTVKDFSSKLSDFFIKQFQIGNPGPYDGPDMIFLVGGYDEGAAYGTVFELGIPSRPTPKEWYNGPREFGIVWGGQKEVAERLVNGFDPGIFVTIKDTLKLTDQQVQDLSNQLKQKHSVPIPYPFLPLQDCVDLAVFMIRTTMTIHRWMVGVRGVGGAIDVATFTRTEGFKPIQQKVVMGERTFV